VEPVIQQQFFTLSPPMGAGQEYVPGMGGNVIMDHTPTNSILAALNDASYAPPDTSFSSSSLDGGASSYVGGSGFGSLDGMNFMDHQGHSGVDMTFGDSGFDVNSFAQEFVMSATPSGEGDASAGTVKDEAQVVG
jgi:hypothetical protein